MESRKRELAEEQEPSAATEEQEPSAATEEQEAALMKQKFEELESKYSSMREEVESLLKIEMSQLSDVDREFINEISTDDSIVRLKAISALKKKRKSEAVKKVQGRRPDSQTPSRPPSNLEEARKQFLDSIH